MYVIVTKLKALKQDLRKLHCRHYLKISDKVQESYNLLLTCQEQLSRYPCNGDLQRQEKQLLSSSQGLWRTEECILAQPVKFDFVQLGDQNNSYFNASLKCRAASNRINTLVNDQGTRIYDLMLIKNEILGFYEGLLRSSTSVVEWGHQDIARGACLTNDQQELMLKVPGMDEIKSALWDIPVSPGSDGYGALFFKASRALVGNDICEAIINFFLERRLLRQVNTTSITLVPKIQPFYGQRI